MKRYFVSEYTDGPEMRWKVIDRQTQEAWLFASKEAAQIFSAKLEELCP